MARDQASPARSSTVGAHSGDRQGDEGAGGSGWIGTAATAAQWKDRGDANGPPMGDTKTRVPNQSLIKASAPADRLGRRARRPPEGDPVLPAWPSRARDPARSGSGGRDSGAALRNCSSVALTRSSPKSSGGDIFPTTEAPRTASPTSDRPPWLPSPRPTIWAGGHGPRDAGRAPRRRPAPRAGGLAGRRRAPHARSPVARPAGRRRLHARLPGYGAPAEALGAGAPTDCTLSKDPDSPALLDRDPLAR